MDIYAGILKDDYDTKFYPYLKALKKGNTKHTCFVELLALSIHYKNTKEQSGFTHRTGLLKIRFIIKVDWDVAKEHGDLSRKPILLMERGMYGKLDYDSVLVLRIPPQKRDGDPDPLVNLKIELPDHDWEKNGWNIRKGFHTDSVEVSKRG